LISAVGETEVCTSIIVAAELRFSAAKKKSPRLTSQLDAILAAMDVMALETPLDAVYGSIRADLERIGQPIGGNDLLIAAQALALDLTLVTDNEREFSHIESLRVENWIR
jgi:tRNA(fMet)-specific endonuclease VapC